MNIINNNQTPINILVYVLQCLKDKQNQQNLCYAMKKLKIIWLKAAYKETRKRRCTNFQDNTMKRNTICMDNYTQNATTNSQSFIQPIDNYASVIHSSGQQQLKIIKNLNSDTIISSKQITKGIIMKQNTSMLSGQLIRDIQSHHSQYRSMPIKYYHGLAAIKANPFDAYLKKNLRKSASIFKKQQFVLKYNSESISKSFLFLPKNLNQTAVLMFDHLLKAAEDVSTTLPSLQQTDKDLQLGTDSYPLYYMGKFLELVMSGTQSLHEQAYIQVIGQCSESNKIRRYLRILNILSATIKVPSTLYLPILNYLYSESIKYIQQQYKQYISYNFHNIIKNYNLKINHILPSLYILQCYVRMNKIKLIISNTNQFIYIQNYTLVQEIINYLIHLLKLNYQQKYLLLIQNTLFQHGLAVNSISSICTFKQTNIWNDYIHFKGIHIQLVPKYAHLNLSPNNLLIAPSYVITQYLKEILPIGCINYARIAQFIMRSQMTSPQAYQFDLKTLLSNKIYSTLSQSQKEALIISILKYDQVCTLTSQQAERQAMVQLLRENGGLTHFFQSLFCIEDEEQFGSIGISHYELIFIQQMHKRTIKSIALCKIEKIQEIGGSLNLKIVGQNQISIKVVNINLLLDLLKYTQQNVKSH